MWHDAAKLFRAASAIQNDRMNESHAWHTAASEEIAALLDTDLKTGLTEEEAVRRRSRHGPNELPPPVPVSGLSVFVRQFSSLMIWVLAGAAVISGFLQEWVDAFAILAIIVLNALLGFIQEYKAERSLAALRKLSIATARVIRGGAMQMIPARDLVPGDLIQVEAGDHVPADARLTYVAVLRTQEASLTGESTAVDKTEEVQPGASLPIGDQRNMLFLGTDVIAGKGMAVVVSTGMQTQLGRIAAMMQVSGKETTPLQLRLEQLGRVLLVLTLVIVTVVFALGLMRGEPLLAMFLTAVSLAVAAIPEGLPAIVTITLALGVTRMVKRHALIRRLPAVETLGATTVICTDKTGTLTKNEMTATAVYVGCRRFEVTGEGYDPTGDLVVDGMHAPDTSALHDLLVASVLCNNAGLDRDHAGWRIVGDPTEGSLLVLAAKRGILQSPYEAERPFIGELPFDGQRKMMTVLRRGPDGIIAYVKGAPDVLVPRCIAYVSDEGRELSLDESGRRTISEANEAFARQALRVLAIARRRLDTASGYGLSHRLERDLVFLGLVAMKDPLRPEAAHAVAACRSAGIQTVMITGDHRDTAVAIARELGLLNGYEAISGTELDGLSEEELRKRVDRIAVFARVSAEHKLRVIRAWKARGAVVAMTGDGVNDAPAVKEADIGVAMGISGTDVTKEASDMIVTDDNFASIAAAVETGRGIYSNILKAIQYLLSGNIGEILVMVSSTLFGFPLPLLPVQILWINLVTDSLPAIALAVDPSGSEIMQAPPRRTDAHILDAERMALMLGQGLFLSLITMFAFLYSLYGRGDGVEQARTLAFTVLMMAQVIHAFNCRSNETSLFVLGLTTNKPLLWGAFGSVALNAMLIMVPFSHPIFKVAALTWPQWGGVFVLSLSPVAAMELWKFVKTRKNGRPAPGPS